MNERNIDIAALILRVSLGVMFIAHGLLKIMVFTMPGTMKFFVAFNIPGWLAYPVTAMEIVGGLLLITGVATRSVVIVLMPVLLGALYVHMGNGWVFSYKNGGWEYPAFLIAMLAVQGFLGAGRYALVFSRRSESIAPQPNAI
jgi:putative oxidoreductase